MANYTFNKEVLENKYNTLLTTEVNLNQFLTVDNTLSEGAGDTKRIVYRSVNGSVDEVGMGVGNTNDIEVTGYYNDYQIKTTQAHGFYYDEEAQKDSMVVDTMLKGIAEKMTEDWNSKIIGEFDKAVRYEIAGTINFDSFADALAKFGEKNEDLFALVSPVTIATLRKNLKDDLKYSEAFSRTGYIGSVCGIPVYMSAAMKDGEVIIASKEAVKAFINKTNEIESKRDANLRKNEYWVRTVALIALVNDKKVCRIASAATTATTITTASASTVAGAATTGAVVKVYVNNELKKTVTAASSAYSVSLDSSLSTGDVVAVVAKKDGQVSSSANTTVA